jgi:hypothetical protein
MGLLASCDVFKSLAQTAGFAGNSLYAALKGLLKTAG